MRTLADLKIGEQATIKELRDPELSLKLVEMGCTPGCQIQVFTKAPFGGPICIRVCGYNLSMRLEDASSIALD